MTSNQARSFALTIFAAVLTMSSQLDAQQTHGKWSLCGAGKYELTAGGQSVGSETFEITCKPDGKYSATGRTQLTGAAVMDLTTNLELTADLLPISASAKGTLGGRPFEQSGTFSNGSATLIANGQTQTVQYTPSASWLGGNIFFANAFIAARYDEAKGGVQQFAVFPQMSMTLERQEPDAVRLPTGEPAVFARFVMRIGPQELVMWRDDQGRLAVMSVPAQKFAAARPDAARFVSQLLDPTARQAGKPSSSEHIDYSAPAGAPFTAEEVTIPVATYSLAGTLLVPKSGKGPYPAAVMITGSGLQTRDQRIALAGLEKYMPFRQIAERLAANGVAVLRVDDRGIGGSTGRETLATVTTTLFAEDTRAQVAWLRTRKEIDPSRILVIGHSEGASIAAMIGASDPKLAAVVMMAGVAKRGADVSFEQQEDMLKSDTTMTEETKNSLREKQKEIVKTVLAGGDVPGFNAWTREYFLYDPLPTARKIKQPLLILQGERDRQVDQSHATMLVDAVRGAGNKDVTLKVFPTLNHLFLPSTTGSFSEYGHLSTNAVPDDVLAVLTNWVVKETRAK